nr:MAG TPA: Protein of unknown function (DUF551) [Bacteriophage sp.]
MTTEQIVKALRVCGESRFCKECPSNELKDTMGVYPCADLLMMKAADLIEQQAARIAELKAKAPRWIPVTERLPEAKEGNWSGIARVLVTVQPYCFLTDEPATPYATSAAYDIEQRIFDVGGLGAINAVPFESDKPRLTITHWVPYPKPPKEGT